MKAHIQILACIFVLAVIALWADQKPEEKLILATPSSQTSISLATTATASQMAVTLPSHYDIVWMSDNAAGRMLSINGLSEIHLLGGSNYLFYKKSVPPEKPEEIKIELWTKDGKHWVAEWKESK